MTPRLDAAVKALAAEPFLRDLTHVEVKGPDGKWAWAGCVAKARVHPRGVAGEEQFVESLTLLAAGNTSHDEIEVRVAGGELPSIALPTAKSKSRIRRALRPPGSAGR